MKTFSTKHMLFTPFLCLKLSSTNLVLHNECLQIVLLNKCCGKKLKLANSALKCSVKRKTHKENFEKKASKVAATTTTYPE